MATIKDLKRMCENMACTVCPLSGGNVNDCWVIQPPDSYLDEDIDEIVDEWVEEHPDDCRAERLEKNIMTELKPCPFCGEKPDDCIRGLTGYDCINLHMVIVCRKCHIEKTIDVQGDVSFERLIEAHEKLIKDWNTRVGE